jgi:hypothetical protein
VLGALADLALTRPWALLATTIAAAALAGTLLAADLYAGKAFGFAVVVGLVLDLVLVKVPLLAALARWSG